MAIINTCCWEVGSKDCCRTPGERDRYKIRIKKKKTQNISLIKLTTTISIKLYRLGVYIMAYHQNQFKTNDWS
jgi:hypothetical protein